MADVSFDLKMDDGRSIDAFHQILEARSKELGETTKNSCIAVAINILKSLRSETRVAKSTEKADITVKCVDDKFYPSWKSLGRKRVRCLRAGMNGSVIDNQKVAWLKPYATGVQFHSYLVTDNIGQGKKVTSLVVGESEEDAVQWMRKKHKLRIQHRRGLAKLALGLAMHEVSDSENVSDSVEQQVRKAAASSTEARVTESGFNSGDVSIYVHDKLNYAIDALKSGQSSVTTATQSALNKMTAYMIHRLKQNGLDTNMKIPFPELKRG